MYSHNENMKHTHHLLVAVIMLFWLSAVRSVLLGRSGGDYGATVVVMLGPPGASGCSDPSADRLPFEVPVVTNFPLSQLYCDCGVGVTEGGVHRLAGGGGRVLCVDGDTAGGLVWEIGRGSSREECNWELSRTNVTNGTLHMGNSMWGVDNMLLASPASGGGHHVTLYMAGGGLGGDGLRRPMGNSTIGRFFDPGVTGVLSRAVDGRGPGANQLVLPTDDRQFKLLRVASPVNARAPRVAYSDLLHMGRACNTPSEYSQRRSWPPEGGWFFEFDLLVSGRITSDVGAAPLVTVGGEIAGISVWAGVFESRMTLTVRWTPSRPVLLYECTNDSSWRIHSDGRVYRDQEEVPGANDTTAFPDGITDSLLTHSAEKFAVSWFPHGCASLNTTVRWLRVSEATALSQQGVPMVQRCYNETHMTCIFEDPVRPWDRVWQMAGDVGAGQLGALPPPFAPVAMATGASLLEVAAAQHFAIVTKFELPQFGDGTPFRIVVAGPEVWGPTGWAPLLGGTHEVHHGTRRNGETLVARVSDTGEAGDEFWCFGGDCTRIGVPFALCGVSPMVCVTYDHSTGSVATTSLDTNVFATIPVEMGLVIRAHHGHAISRLEFAGHPGTCLSFRALSSITDVSLVVDDGCESESTISFITTSELSNSDDPRMWLTISHNILLPPRPVIAVLDISPNGTIYSQIFPTQAAVHITIRPGRQLGAARPSSVVVQHTHSITRTRIAFAA